jgi:hypothetical protein
LCAWIAHVYRAAFAAHLRLGVQELKRGSAMSSGRSAAAISLLATTAPVATWYCEIWLAKVIATI